MIGKDSDFVAETQLRTQRRLRKTASVERGRRGRALTPFASLDIAWPLFLQQRAEDRKTCRIRRRSSSAACCLRSIAHTHRPAGSLLGGGGFLGFIGYGIHLLMDRSTTRAPKKIRGQVGSLQIFHPAPCMGNFGKRVHGAGLWFTLESRQQTACRDKNGRCQCLNVSTLDKREHDFSPASLTLCRHD